MRFAGILVSSWGGGRVCAVSAMQLPGGGSEAGELHLAFSSDVVHTTIQGHVINLLGKLIWISFSMFF